MKTPRYLASCAAIAAMVLAGSAYAGENSGDHGAWRQLGTASEGAPVPSFGTPISVLSADSTLKLAVNPDGSVSPGSIAAFRDQGVALHLTNNSAQPVRVSIEGDGAAPVQIGEIAAGQPADFAWRFDTWSATPKTLRIGQAAVGIYVHAPLSSN